MNNNLERTGKEAVTTWPEVISSYLFCKNCLGIRKRRPANLRTEKLNSGQLKYVARLIIARPRLVK